MNDATTISITVPNGAGSVVAFEIRFAKAQFAQVCELIEFLVEPNDVLLAAEMGEWEMV